MSRVIIDSECDFHYVSGEGYISIACKGFLAFSGRLSHHGLLVYLFIITNILKIG